MRRNRTSHDLQAEVKADEMMQAAEDHNHNHNHMCDGDTESESDCIPSPPSKRRVRTRIATDPFPIKTSPILFSVGSPESESESPPRCSLLLFGSQSVSPGVSTQPNSTMSDLDGPSLGVAHGMASKPKSRRIFRASPFTPSKTSQKQSKSFAFDALPTTTTTTTNTTLLPSESSTSHDLMSALTAISISSRDTSSKSTITQHHMSDARSLLLSARSPYSGVPVSAHSASLVHQEMLFALFSIFGVACIMVGWVDMILRTKRR